MKENNFLKEIGIATTFVQNFRDFEAKFDSLKKFVLDSFQESIWHLLPSKPSLAILTSFCRVVVSNVKPFLLRFVRLRYVFEPVKIMLKP